MSIVRRWYIYLVSAISLQAVSWAIIALLRNLLIWRLHAPITSIAFQMAVIVVGLPIFLAHWVWGQRLAGKVVEERGATVRRLYLYGMMAAFLAPFALSAFDLISTLLRVVFTDWQPYGLTSGDAIVHHLLALLVVGLLWLYHQWVVAEDSKAVPERGGAATVRRLYVLGFSAAGLAVTTLTIIRLVDWIMLQFGGGVVKGVSLDVGLTAEIAGLSIGVPLWLIFWRWAQRLFEGPSEEERESALRKFYLYGTVFVGALGVVATVTAILADLFRRVLSLPPEGDIRLRLSMIIGMGMLWAYHTFVLRDDAEKAGEVPRQAGVRRLYLYLIAAIGLSALLGGLGGDISVIIRSLDKGFGTELRGQLSWFTAAIIVGLPVWILPWRQVQNRAVESGPAGTDARRSTVRKIYVYFFLFVATMTVLSSAVFIVFKILSMFLGAAGPTLSELGHSIAFSMIAVGVWLYHGFILRSDHRLSGRERVSQLEDLRVAVVDVGAGRFGRAVVDAFKREAPELDLEPIVLTEPGTAVLGEGIEKSDEEIATQLAQAGVIIGPWMIAVPGGAQGRVTAAIAQAVLDSPARKLLAPTWAEGWDWAGVGRWDAEALARQTVSAVKQIAAGEEVKPARPLGAGAIIAIIIGALFLLPLLASSLFSLVVR